MKKSCALALLKRLFVEPRGSFFIEHSSLVLLIAIAAIALFVRLGGTIPG